MTHEPTRLRTTYGLLVDSSTYRLLNQSVFEDADWIVSQYLFRWERIGNEYYLTYVVPNKLDNEYTHKAVHKWLRSTINMAKKEPA